MTALPAEPDPRRQLPQVDALARQVDGDAPGPLARRAARRVVARARQDPDAFAGTDLVAAVREELAARTPARRVLNATGVLLHTNLGRAPLTEAVAAEATAAGYADVELDLRSGQRGRRLAGLEEALCALTGAEAALVVNNNAAAVLLVLAAVAAGGEVVVSRGQLVEIGGSFRVPEVIVQGGARLREVGTTNRTRLADYEAAIGESTACLLVVHPSNYRIVGFTEEVPTARLAALASARGLPLVVDLGSGLLDAGCPWLDGAAPEWVRSEPAAVQALRDGADVVTFSGDKLLGGPQAGIVCGRAELVDRARRHPLARALRYDKTRAAVLHATLDRYLRGTAADIGFWRLATAEPGRLRRRAELLAAMVRRRAGDAADVAVREVTGRAGGGSLPGEAVPDVAVVVRDADADALAARLRRGEPAVLAVVRDGAVQLHLRAVDEDDDRDLAEALLRAVVPDRRGPR